MPQRLPRVTAAQLVRALRRGGWRVHHQTGGHAQLEHPSYPGRVTVPMHASLTLSPKTVASILDQAGLSADELRQLL